MVLGGWGEVIQRPKSFLALTELTGGTLKKKISASVSLQAKMPMQLLAWYCTALPC